MFRVYSSTRDDVWGRVGHTEPPLQTQERCDLNTSLCASNWTFALPPWTPCDVESGQASSVSAQALRKLLHAGRSVFKAAQAGSLQCEEGPAFTVWWAKTHCLGGLVRGITLTLSNSLYQASASRRLFYSLMTQLWSVVIQPAARAVSACLWKKKSHFFLVSIWAILEWCFVLMLIWIILRTFVSSTVRWCHVSLLSGVLAQNQHCFTLHSAEPFAVRCCGEHRGSKDWEQDGEGPTVPLGDRAG